MPNLIKIKKFAWNWLFSAAHMFDRQRPNCAHKKIVIESGKPFFSPKITHLYHNYSFITVQNVFVTQRLTCDFKINLHSRHDKVLQILFPHSKETKRQSGAGAPPRFMRRCPVAAWLRLWACTCGKPCSNKSTRSVRCQRDMGEADGQPFWRKLYTLQWRFDTQIKHQSRSSGLQKKKKKREVFFLLCLLRGHTHEHLTWGLVCRSWSHRWLEAAGNKPNSGTQSHPSLQVVSTQTFNLSELSYVLTC